jgi:hypothetical protein
MQIQAYEEEGENQLEEPEKNLEIPAQVELQHNIMMRLLEKKLEMLTVCPGQTRGIEIRQFDFKQTTPSW